ncbi:MAG: Gfo/Idh/MocA family oxidoreductase [Erythrobacter sp.]
MAWTRRSVSEPIRIAIIGLGKIARDAHAPAISANPAFDLVATVDPAGGFDEYPAFRSADDFFDSGIAVDAVSICTPPAVRSQIASRCLMHGLAVMLEKPPAVSTVQAAELEELARNSGVGLLAAWHSRFAPGYVPACDATAGHRIICGKVTWREDVRQWHPGQDWIFADSGFGVFDPAINALSFLLGIDPTISVDQAKLFVPRGREMPIRAQAGLRSESGGRIDCDFDFLWPGNPEWTIELKTTAGAITLESGGHRLLIDGRSVELPKAGEYVVLYQRFAQIVHESSVDCDVAPLRIVENCLSFGERFSAPSFSF